MIRSMTAFASAECESPVGQLACEVRTVNHRFLDQSLRLDEPLRAFEPLLRERVSARLARGKVDLTLRLRGSAAGGEIKLNHALLQQLAHVHMELDTQFPGLRLQLTELLRYPGVLCPPDVDQAALAATVTKLADTALDALVATREREGRQLAALVTARLEQISALVEDVRALLPEIRTALRERLEARLADIGAETDPGRLEQELVLQLNRVDVDEELDRLEAHVTEARRVLAGDEAAGRRLDFLMQEFNREANTLGSKSVDARTGQAAVDLKVLIEQIREQVQNIE